MTLDTGASLSLISETTLLSTLSPLTPSNFTLTTYIGEKIFLLESTNVQVNYQTQCASIPVLVVSGDCPTLLGRNWLEEIKINWSDIKLLNTFSTIELVLDQRSAVFTSSIGKLKEITTNILVNSEAHPQFLKACPVLIL